jgi:hypothetical protein
MFPRRALSFLCVFFALSLALAAFQGRKREDPNIRMVQGTVTDSQGRPVDGAIVQLKNTKNLQVRSFITKDQGSYYFHNLDTNTDYELKAEYQDQVSPVKTLSSFDSRPKPVINLKLEPKK